MRFTPIKSRGSIAQRSPSPPSDQIISVKWLSGNDRIASQRRYVSLNDASLHLRADCSRLSLFDPRHRSSSRTRKRGRNEQLRAKNKPAVMTKLCRIRAFLPSHFALFPSHIGPPSPSLTLAHPRPRHARVCHPGHVGSVRRGPILFHLYLPLPAVCVSTGKHN